MAQGEYLKTQISRYLLTGQASCGFCLRVGENKRMERKQDGLVLTGKGLPSLDGPVKAIRNALPRTRDHFTPADQIHQLISSREADPERGFVARTAALCALPRRNPGNRHQYKRANGPFKPVMVAGADNKLPFGNFEPGGKAAIEVERLHEFISHRVHLCSTSSNNGVRSNGQQVCESASDHPGASTHRPRSGHNRRKHIGGYFDPAVSTQLRHLAVDENSTVQQLLEEALDLLFQTRGKPLIAQIPKS